MNQEVAALLTPQVAVIVPFYNVVEHLPRQLRAIGAQTCGQMEVILVDDGSTDGAGTLAAAFAAKHVFARVIHQANAGAGAARNAGLEASKAPYVCFIDSDDIISRDYVASLLQAAQESRADIAVCGYRTCYRGGVTIRFPLSPLLGQLMSTQQAIGMLLRDRQIKNYIWNKLFSRTLFENPRVRFPSMLFEDMATMPHLFAKANKVAVVKRPLYTYFQRQGSLMADFSMVRVQQNTRALSMVRSFLLDHGLFQTMKGHFQVSTRRYSWAVGYCALVASRAEGMTTAWRQGRMAWRRVRRLGAGEPERLEGIP